MALRSKVELDATDWRILTELQEDSRIGHAELGRRVHLSPPAVAARIRRLEGAGVICGYRVELGLPALGLDVFAFVRVSSHSTSRRAFLAAVAGMAEVLECHHVTGEDFYVVKVATASMAELEQAGSRLGPHRATT